MMCDIVVHDASVGQNWWILVLHFCWLVGAFSVFGRADTGKPVQNYWLFSEFEARREF